MLLCKLCCEHRVVCHSQVAVIAALNSLTGVSPSLMLLLTSEHCLSQQHLPKNTVQCSVGVLEALSAVLQELLLWSAYPFSIAIHQHITVELAQM